MGGGANGGGAGASAGWELVAAQHEIQTPAAVFSRSPADFTLSQRGSVATATRGGPSYYSAASSVAMRGGRHYAAFTLLRAYQGMCFSLIRPGYDVEHGQEAWNVDGHCFYRTGYGHHYPGHIDWEGRQTAR